MTYVALACVRAEAASRHKLIEELTKDATAEELLNDAGLLMELKKRLIETALDAEMTDHLGYEKHSPDGRGTGNSRNGKTFMRVITGDSELEIAVPRDRNGAFEPKLVRNRQVHLPGFDEKVLSRYARGMTTREMQSHLQEIYEVAVSPALISKVTDVGRVPGPGHRSGRPAGVAGLVDRRAGGCQVMAGRADRAAGAQGEGHPDRGRGRPDRLPRGDREPVPEDPDPAVHRAHGPRVDEVRADRGAGAGRT